MAYVQRNKTGNIVGVFETSQSVTDEVLPLHSAELIEYLAQSTESEDAKVALSTSDGELIRVLEDLITTLIDKKVILFTDLPYAAREKLSSREKVRGQLNSLDNLMADDEGIL
jgi:tRNA U34 5-carboxymethylaminomethyl modifying GTPase MnmE/TrmE